MPGTVKPKLLLCFDAFGTLFRPKDTPAQQYMEVAQQCGLHGFTEAELESSMKLAFSDEMKRNPNHGKENGMNATEWWTNVIHKSFTPLLQDGQEIPATLVPALWHRFSSHEGYEAEEGLASTLASIKHSNRDFEQVVVGVITNSDDRVPDVLSSFGVHVSPLRYGTEVDPEAVKVHDKPHAVDFHCISYDVGVEKPDKRIFHAAEHMLARLIEIREGKTPGEALDDVGTWKKLYVGDEMKKDVHGARNAGWDAVLLDTGSECHQLPKVEDHLPISVGDLVKQHSSVSVGSIRNLVAWVNGEENKIH